MRQITLVLHFLGLGLLVTALVGGYLLNGQYRKAREIREKAAILKSARPFGLLSPIAMLLMLVTGIGNMHALAVGILDLGWLSAKLVTFAVTVVAGIFLGGVARKRGKLVQALSAGEGGPEAEKRIAAYDSVVSAGYVILPILLLVILYLSAIGRLGAQ